MAVSQQELQELLRLLKLTRAEELDCEECFSRLAEFADLLESGRPIPDALQSVKHHLDLCRDCREMFEIFLRALGTTQD